MQQAISLSLWFLVLGGKRAPVALQAAQLDNEPHPQ
jgi:hypothetical protein